MAEICSSYPSAGSVYHWAGMLSTPKWAPLASYSTVWLNYIGNAAADASFASGFAQVLAAVYELVDVNGIEEKTQYGISIAIMVFWGLCNALRVDKQGWINNFATFV